MSELTLKYKARPQQSTILEFFKKSIDQDKKFILIDAPTGSGKSYLPSLLGDWYIDNVNKQSQIDIITCTKNLQVQYTKDFQDINNLWGKNNYYCERHDCSCKEGEMLNKNLNMSCYECPYKADFDHFLNERMGLTNFYMYNSLRIYAAGLFDNLKNSNLLFVDESHLYEENFCSFLSSTISPKALNNVGISDKDLMQKINSIKTIGDARRYLVKHLLPELKKKEKTCLAQISSASNSKHRMKLIKKHNKLDSYKCRFNRFIQDEDHSNWVLDYEYSDDESTKIINIKPVWAKKDLKRFVWDKYDHVVLMSGTILDPINFSKQLGLDFDKTSYYKLDHSFPAKQRPIMFLDSGNLSRRHFDSSIGHIIKRIRSIIRMHKNHKGIIHTGNYRIANEIKERIGDNRLLFHDSSDREEVIERHLESKKPTILVSPSMFTGLDLKDDLSRFQIIVKMPYPYLGSKVIQKRKNEMPKWYNWKTMNDLLQSYGRSVRSKNDWAYTYILDSSFSRFIKSNINILPEYFAEGLQEGRKVLKKMKSKK